MPPRIPAGLQLNTPQYEEDIGDLSPYLVLPSSTSSRASSSTIASSLAECSPRNNYAADEFDSDIPLSSHITPGSVETPKRLAFSSRQLPSASPSLATFPSSPEIRRSHTLPRTFQIEKEAVEPRLIHTEINALAVDAVSIGKMRRWILAIAVGM